MTEMVIDSKEDIKFLAQFSSKMNQIKKIIDRENKAYEKGGVLGMAKVGDEFFKLMDDLRVFYYDLQKEDVLSKISQERLQSFNDEHESFLKSLKRYEINCQVVSKISDMFLEATKDSMQASTRTDFGYDKNAEMISDKKLMVNMPSIAINNKV